MLVRYADDFVCAFRYRDDAKKFYKELPERLQKFSLDVAPEKIQMMKFSRFHPNMQRKITFLGFEIYWFYDRRGQPCIMQRTAPKKLQSACQRIKEWIREHKHLKGRSFIVALNRRLQVHYNYYSLRGNSNSLWRFYEWAVVCSFKWLNRRGGKRNSFTWGKFTKAIKRLGIARPVMKISVRQPIIFA